MSVSFKNVVSSDSGSSRDPVADFASLPASGNSDGDLRVTLDNHNLYVWDAIGMSWDLITGGGGGVTSVNGDSGPSVTLDTDDISEGATNLYYTDARAKLAAVADSITNGITDVAPSQNATFDALALKEPTITATSSSDYYRGDKTFQTLDKAAVGLGNVDNTSDANKPVSSAQQIAIDAKVADTINDTVTTIAPSQNAVFDALALKLNLGGHTTRKFLVTDEFGGIITNNNISVDPLANGIQAYQVFQTPADAGDIYVKTTNLEAEIDPNGENTAQSHIDGLQLDYHFDRTGSGGDLSGGLNGLSLNVTHEGSGTVSQLNGTSTYIGLGNNTDGETTNAIVHNTNLNVLTGHSAGSVTLRNEFVSVNGTIDNFTLSSVGGAFDVTNNVNADSWNFQGDIGGNYSGTSRTITGNITGNVNLSQLLLTGNAQSFTGSQIQQTGDSDSFLGQFIKADGTYVNYANGLQIDMNSATVTGGLPTAIQTQGRVDFNALADIPDATSAVILNGITTTPRIQSGSPVSGTFVFANFFGGLCDISDDMGSDGTGIGIGLSTSAYAGQIKVAAGKTIEDFNGILLGFGIGDPSSSGTVNHGSMLKLGGFLPQGGTVVTNNLYGLHIIPAFSSTAVKAHGLYLDNTDLLNYVGGKSLFGGSYSDPTVEVDIDGDLRIRNLSSIGVLTNDASGNVSNVLPGTVGNVLYSNGTAWIAQEADLPILSSAVVLTDNTPAATTFLSYAKTNTSAIFDYSIVRGTDVRTGRLLISTNGTTVVLSDDFVEDGSVGVVLSAIVSGSNVELQYTTTNTGSDADLKHYNKKWN